MIKFINGHCKTNLDDYNVSKVKSFAKVPDKGDYVACTRKGIFIALFFLIHVTIFAQINFSSDIVNRFVWRGQNVGGNSLHIQPLVYYTIKNVEIGAFGSYALSNEYNEIDLYVKYSLNNFYCTYTNYYVPILPDGTPLSTNTKFFNFNNKTTSNIGEFSIGYIGKKIPLFISLNSFVFGNDKHYGINDNDSVNYYSTYLEIGYKLNKTDLFIGGTPWSGYYGRNANIINIGFKSYKNIQFTEKYSLPAYLSLSINPLSENIFIVCGLTF